MMKLSSLNKNNVLINIGNESAGKRAKIDVAKAMMTFAKDKAALARATLMSVGLAAGLSATACAQENAQKPVPVAASTDDTSGVQYAGLTPKEVSSEATPKVEDEWDLGFGEDLAREKAETAQVKDEIAQAEARLEREKAETLDAEQINTALKETLEKNEAEAKTPSLN